MPVHALYAPTRVLADAPVEPLDFWALRRTVSGGGGIDGATETVRNFLLFARRPGGLITRMLGAALRRFWQAPRFEHVTDEHPCYFLWHHLFACLAASYAPFGRELARVRKNGALEQSQGLFFYQYRRGHQLGRTPITPQQRAALRKGPLFKLTLKGGAEAAPGSILEHFLRIGTAEGQTSDEPPSVSSPPQHSRRKPRPYGSRRPYEIRKQQTQSRTRPAEAGAAAYDQAVHVAAATGPVPGFDAGLGVKF